MVVSKNPQPAKSIADSTLGFTLVEVLVSMMVLSIGLLGVAGLQARSVRDNHNAYLRSQASMLAYEIGDRMRANREALISNSAIYNLAIADNAPSSPANCVGSSIACSTSDLVQFDQSDWLNRVSTTLPSGDAGISCNTARVCTVTVAWDENRDGTRDDLAPQATGTQSFDSFGVLAISSQL
jgi:type IV pilus assembly protein PilV